MSPSLADQLAQIAPMLPQVRRQWQYARTTNRANMTWEHPEMGSFLIAVDHGGRLGPIQSSVTYSWTKIAAGEPSAFGIEFAANLNDTVFLVFQVRGNDLTQCVGNIPSLEVKVEWKNGLPKTRERDADNVDHFLVNADGIIVQLQTSLVTRGDTFYISNQELWAAKIVEVSSPSNKYKTHEVNGKFYAAVNLWDDQAYLGSDFLFTNSKTGPQLIEAMLSAGFKPDFYEVRPEIDWNPPAFPQKEGFAGAVVLWFNPNVGGKVICEDGSIHFIPLKGIRDAEGRSVMKRGEFCLMTPKQQVLLRVEHGINTVRPIEVD